MPIVCFVLRMRPDFTKQHSELKAKRRLKASDAELRLSIELSATPHSSGSERLSVSRECSESGHVFVSRNQVKVEQTTGRKEGDGRE